MECLYGTKCLYVETVTNLFFQCPMITFSPFISLIVLEAWGATTGGAIPATLPILVVLSSNSSGPNLLP